MPGGHEPRHLRPAAVADLGKSLRRHDLKTVEMFAKQRQRMPAQAETGGGVIGGDVLPLAGRRQQYVDPRSLGAETGRGEQTIGNSDPRAVPEGAMPVSGEFAQGVGGGQRFQILLADAAAEHELLDTGKGAAVAGLADRLGGLPRQAFHLVETDPQARRQHLQRMFPRPHETRGRLQAAIGQAVIDVDREHFDAMGAGVADQLRRGVEAHRLAVEQGTAKSRRMIMLEPGRDIGQQGETR